MACLSLSLSGCISPNPDAMRWKLPDKPYIQSSVQFTRQGEGFHITEEDATKLADNIDEYKAYIEKLMILIEAMADYHEDELFEDDNIGRL